MSQTIQINSKELDLVVRLTRPSPAAADWSEASQSFGTDFNWQNVLDLSGWYQVSGFVGRHLDDSRFEAAVPIEVRRAGHALAEEIRVRTVFFVEPELTRILAICNREQIPVIALKGAALIRRVYSDLGLRPLGDLDLLIEEQHLPQARSLLRELGYRHDPSETDVDQSVDNYHFCPRLLSPDGSIEIELHRHLVRRSSPLYFEVEELWDRAVEIEIGDEPAFSLGHEDLLMHLGVKFFVDRALRHPSYASLRQLADVAALVERYGATLDWEYLIERARARGHHGLVYCSLYAARSLLDMEMEPLVMARLRPDGLEEGTLNRFIRRKVFDRDPWFFHGLVEPTENRTWDIAKSAVRRVRPERKFLREKYWDQPATVGLGSLYRRHLAELGHTIATTPVGGRRIREHLGVDRWMHRIVTDSL